jgi:hypothetical protein
LDRVKLLRRGMFGKFFKIKGRIMGHGGVAFNSTFEA